MNYCHLPELILKKSFSLQVKNIQQDREMMLASNKSLAEYNLDIRPRFEELKQTIAKNYAEISQLKTKLAEDIGNLGG